MFILAHFIDFDQIADSLKWNLFEIYLETPSMVEDWILVINKLSLN